MSILVFAGSLRRESLNRKLAGEAARAVAAAGGQVTLLELADYPLPLYDGDLEADSGPPENAFRLQAIIADHAGLIVVSPEYNHSIPALLKNTLDWVSRTPRVRGANPFTGKVAGLMAASPGALGGLQGLDTVQRVLATLGCLVLPKVVAVPKADQVFDGEGRLTDGASARRVAELAAEVVAVASRLSP
ncbi:MAG TPA: NAD(P)H-dependent oxidoreductase [Thiobacillaceae bacterium]|nr:NAD(P)H-dependent oxidoreductase [Thiobacillaceae bacterium]HNH89949.1 NAD(P)H-dependent oxidoreductase [Thiobacillaceae bacterium]